MTINFGHHIGYFKSVVYMGFKCHTIPEITVKTVLKENISFPIYNIKCELVKFMMSYRVRSLWQVGEFWAGL